MTVMLDFQIDADVLAEDRQSDPATADPAVLETTYFTMPVRFSVGGAELFSVSSDVWLRQPLLGFATHMLLSLGALRSTGAATCSVAGAGTLFFQRRGERVRITCSFNRVEVEVLLDELDGSVKRFHRRVEDSLRALVPDLTRHPAWPTWFPAR